LLILGLTADGRCFRPSDWAQRLAAAATVGCAYCVQDPQLPFNPMVRVVLHEGVAGLWLAADLADRDPLRYEFLLRFAEQNGLVVRRA
jgi:hypothetical protein